MMLETPEGLHHYQKVLELLKIKEMRKVNTEWFETAGILLKEMAEALYNIQAEVSEELSDPSLFGTEVKQYAREALQKFKEWK